MKEFQKDLPKGYSKRIVQDFFWEIVEFILKGIDKGLFKTILETIDEGIAKEIPEDSFIEIPEKVPKTPKIPCGHHIIDSSIFWTVGKSIIDFALMKKQIESWSVNFIDYLYKPIVTKNIVFD